MSPANHANACDSVGRASVRDSSTGAR
jgi:hypothetical protein